MNTTRTKHQPEYETKAIWELTKEEAELINEYLNNYDMPLSHSNKYELENKILNAYKTDNITAVHFSLCELEMILKAIESQLYLINLGELNMKIYTTILDMVDIVNNKSIVGKT